MSSSQLVLAYHSRRTMSELNLETRIRHASDHLQKIFPDDDLSPTHVGDGITGFIVWTSPADEITWPQVEHDQAKSKGVAWINIPYSLQHETQDGLSLGINLSRNPEKMRSFGAPLTVISWDQKGSDLQIATDPLGYSRIFEFPFSKNSGLRSSSF